MLRQLKDKNNAFLCHPAFPFETPLLRAHGGAGDRVDVSEGAHGEGVDLNF